MDPKWTNPGIENQRKREFCKFTNDLFKETDRGCVISAVSYLELLVERIVLAQLGDSKAAKNLTGTMRPLGEFSARCDFCLCLGFISSIERSALRQAAEIRNKFAHNLFIEFSDESIRSKVGELRKHPSKEVDEQELNWVAKSDYRATFVNCVSLLASKMLHRDFLVSESVRERTVDIPKQHTELLALMDQPEAGQA